MLRGLDKLVDSINFKKVTKLYILITIIFLITAFGCTAYLFREKILFTLDYIKVAHNIEHHGINDSTREQLDRLAGSSGDIKDILILDSGNNIIHSAKNSDIGKNNKLQLSSNRERGRYLWDVNDPNVFYKVVRPEKLIISKESIKDSREFKEEYNDEFFYNADFTAKKVYLLNYFIDRGNGMKVFIISDVKPIPYAEQLVETILTLLALIFAIYWLLLALWVYRDANRRNLNAALWGLLILITNLVGLIVYTIYKQNNQICYKCGSLQSKLNTFCSHCGTRMNESCDKCGTKVAKNDNYCIRCGTKLRGT